MNIKSSDDYIYLYTKDYLMNVNGGGEEFLQQGAAERFTRILDLVKFNQTDFVLDLGAGRGEFGYILAEKVKELILSDYSDEALEIIKEQNFTSDNIVVEKINAKRIPYPDNYFDKIFFLEVIEHIYLSEAHIILEEIKRVLKKDGLLIVSTGPNKYLSFPQYFIAKTFFKLKLKEFHVNEYSYFSLNKIFKKHFDNFRIYCYEETMWFFNVINCLNLPHGFKKLVNLLNRIYDIRVFSCLRKNTVLKKVFAQSFLIIAKK